jgi:chitinase
MKYFLLTTFLILSIFNPVFAQQKPARTAIIAYYMGNQSDIDKYDLNKLTHIIFSFLHLKGNKLTVDNADDSLTIRKLVSLKQKYPDVKIILSLGGWGGCKTCSDVFSSGPGRHDFTESVVRLLETYKADGLDLDWEYPALESVEGHPFKPEDRTNFTLLLQTLRTAFGEKYELSFAAGGFQEFLEKSVDWQRVMPLVNYVNMMNYDLVNGNSKRTGHLTSLYSTPQQVASTDHAVRYLDSIGVPMQKVVIGLAFYARLFADVQPINNGLYQKCKFSGYMHFKDTDEKLGPKSGFQFYWDNVAKAPYAYNASTGTFATWDNMLSVYLKTKYVKNKGLGGLMFWELTGDRESGGLLDMIYEASRD